MGTLAVSWVPRATLLVLVLVVPCIIISVIVVIISIIICMHAVIKAIPTVAASALLAPGSP